MSTDYPQPTASTSTLAPSPDGSHDQHPDQAQGPPRKKARTGKARREAKLMAIARKEAGGAEISTIQNGEGQAAVGVARAAQSESNFPAGPSSITQAEGKKRKRSVELNVDPASSTQLPLSTGDDIGPQSSILTKSSGNMSDMANPEQGVQSADDRLAEDVADEDDGVGKGNEGVPEEQTRADMEVVRNRLPQALKSLLPILKKSRTVESQRLIKKIRFLRKKTGGPAGAGAEWAAAGVGKDEKQNHSTDGEVTDLEEQFEVLKKLDLHTIISPLLLSKLSKHRLMRPHLPISPDSPGFTPLFTTPMLGTPARPAAPANDVQAKLENKLLSSKGVAPQIKAVVGWCVGEEGVRLNGPSVLGYKRKAAGHEEEEEERVRPAKESMNEARRAALAARDVGAGMDREGNDSGSGSEGGSDDEGDADGWESGSVDDGDGGAPSADRSARLASLGSIDDDEDGGEDIILNSDYDDEDTVVPEPTPRRKDIVKAAPATKTAKAVSSLPPLRQPKAGSTITSSLFLPSLSTGFVRGENRDEDYGLDVDEKRENKKGGERKNRRGQAERRAIWEKKYGSGANHVKKQQQDEASQAKVSEYEKRQGGSVQGSRWGATATTTTNGTGAGAASASSRTMHGKGSVADRMAGKKATTTAASPAAARAVPDKANPTNDHPKALHPSWEAARLKKLKEGPAALMPQGKKIVF